MSWLLWIACATGAEVAERPAWEVGDKWVGHVKTERPRSESGWSREVRAVLPDGKLRVATETGSIVTLSSDFDSFDERGADYSWRRISFPLTVGKRWSHERRIGNEKALITGYATSTWEVRAYERITVPAGSYDCYRVEGHEYLNERNEQSLGFSRYATRVDTTYWFCPEVKGVAKWRINTDFLSGGAMIQVHTSELTSFEHR